MIVALEQFVIESNLIEGIERAPTREEIDAHARFLELPGVRVGDLEKFVEVVAGVELRSRPGMNVIVGRHLPPSGGPDVKSSLKKLLVSLDEFSPYEAHRRYELLHPFMDGNGRSGRALWAWQMKQNGEDPFALPFLHRWYYQSLSASRDA